MSERDFAFEVAELIYAEAGSGSASWDELHGPSAELRESDGRWQVVLPEGWDDPDGEDPDNSKRWCVITVEMQDRKPLEQEGGTEAYRARWLVKMLQLAMEDVMSRRMYGNHRQVSWDELVSRAQEYGGRAMPPPGREEFTQIRKLTVGDLFPERDGNVT